MEFGKAKRADLANKSLAPGPGQCKRLINLDDVKSESFDQNLFDKPYASKFGTG